MVGSVGVVWPGLVVLFFRCLVCKVWGRVGWQKQKPESQSQWSGEARQGCLTGLPAIVCGGRVH